MIYVVACSTGFREGELATLAPESFELDAEPPAAILPVNVDKRRKEVGLRH